MCKIGEREPLTSRGSPSKNNQQNYIIGFITCTLPNLADDAQIKLIIMEVLSVLYVSYVIMTAGGKVFRTHHLNKSGPLQSCSATPVWE